MSKQALDVVIKAGQLAKQQWPGDTDADKAHRAFMGYKWYVELVKYMKRNEVLIFLDPNKNGGEKQPTVFGVSERHIRRVDTIHTRRPKQFSRLEAIAKKGTVSLETIEHLVLHPSTDLVEVVWLVLDN
jgi:hypothetical protein